MKITTKINTIIVFIAICGIVSIVVSFILQAHFQTHKERLEELNQARELIVEVRLSIRQMVLDSFESIYLNNGGRAEDIKGTIENVDLKTKNALEILQKTNILVLTPDFAFHLEELKSKLLSSINLAHLKLPGDAKDVMEESSHLFKDTISADIQNALGSIEVLREEISWHYDESLEQVIFMIPVVFSVAMVLAMLLMVPISIMFDRKFRKVSDTIRMTDFENAQFPEVHLEGHCELALLAKEFNKLSQKLKETKHKIDFQSQGLMTSAKLSALGEMAAGIAHEINNPLAVIQGKASQVRRNIASEKRDLNKAETDLIKIETTSMKIAKIVKGLRLFSRDAIKDPFEVYSVSQLIEDTLELCRERFKSKNIDIKVSCSEELYLKCRPTQLSQVLMNLLSNSFDAIENLEDRWVEIAATQSGEKINLSVTDSGNGISEEIAGKVMLPFFTTKEAGRGTGLGLSISKGIIELHRGKFYYDPQSEKTRFVMEIPIK